MILHKSVLNSTSDLNCFVYLLYPVHMFFSVLFSYPMKCGNPKHNIFSVIIESINCIEVIIIRILEIIALLQFESKNVCLCVYNYIVDISTLNKF